MFKRKFKNMTFGVATSLQQQQQQQSQQQEEMLCAGEDSSAKPGEEVLHYQPFFKVRNLGIVLSTCFLYNDAITFSCYFRYREFVQENVQARTGIGSRRIRYRLFWISNQRRFASGCQIRIARKRRRLGHGKWKSFWQFFAKCCKFSAI